MTTDNPSKGDLTRVTLGVLLIGLLIVSTFWVLRPFLSALVWATMIVVATWPMMRWLEARFGGRRGPAVLVMTLSMLVAVIVPLAMALTTLADFIDEAKALGARAAHFVVPPVPAWLSELPLVGERLGAKWQAWVGVGTAELLAHLQPYAGQAAAWLVAQAGGIGLLFVHFSLTVVISAILYATGEHAALGLRRFTRRVAGERGDAVTRLAGLSIRAVALGIAVTALVQSLIGGVAIALSGVSYAMVLTSLMFVCCLVQIGPMPVLLPAVLWLFYSGRTGAGIFLTVCAVIVLGLDNVLRPYLIKRGADLPLLLILAGVIGGLLGFGIVGLFIGPVILAVTYTLVNAWIDEGVPATLPDLASAAGAAPDSTSPPGA